MPDLPANTNERIALEILGWSKQHLYIGTRAENHYFNRGNGTFLPIWQYEPIRDVDEAMEALQEVLRQEEQWCRMRPLYQPEEVRKAIPRCELLLRSNGEYSARIYCPTWYPMGERQDTPAKAICDLLVKIMDLRLSHSIVVVSGVLTTRPKPLPSSPGSSPS